MLLDELSSHILKSSTFFVRAPSTTKVPIWLGGFRADRPNTAVSIYETGGPGAVYTFSGITFERPTVQVISRSTSYATARTNAWRIYAILSVVGNVSLPLTTSTGSATVPYVTISPVQSPFDMGSDAVDRQQISCNYQIEKVLS